MDKFIWKSCFLEFNSGSRGRPSENRDSTVTLWPQQCLVRLDVGSFHSRETWATRTSNPIWACQHSACKQFIPTHQTLWAAEIPYLLQRPRVCSPRCFPRVSGPDSEESPDTVWADKELTWAGRGELDTEAQHLSPAEYIHWRAWAGQGHRRKAAPGETLPAHWGKNQRDTSINLSHCSATDEQETHPHSGVLVLGCAKHSSQLVHDCPHLHSTGLLWHREQAHSLPSSASPNCSPRTGTSPSGQPTSRSFSPHCPWKEHYAFPSSMHIPKEAVRRVTSDSLTLPILFMRDHSRTPAWGPSPGPRNPTFSHKPVQQSSSWDSPRLDLLENFQHICRRLQQRKDMSPA